MPQRILRPAWQHAKNPITIKSILLFLAVVFIIYTVITDQQQRQQQFDRYKAIQEYTERSHTALEAVEQNNKAFEQSMQNTSAMLVFMDQMSKSMHEVAEILRINREATLREHQMITQNMKAQSPTAKLGEKKNPRKRSMVQKQCYELKPSDKMVGNNTVRTYEYVRIKCR